jgi:hypothetical protein
MPELLISFNLSNLNFHNYRDRIVPERRGIRFGGHFPAAEWFLVQEREELFLGKALFLHAFGIGWGNDGAELGPNHAVQSKDPLGHLDSVFGGEGSLLARGSDNHVVVSLLKCACDVYDSSKKKIVIKIYKYIKMYINLKINGYW